MLTIAVKTSTLVSEYQRFTRDTSATNIAVGKERMQHYYGYLLSEADNYVIERTKYGDLKDGQRSYLLPPDCIKPKNIRVYIGGIWHEVTEVKTINDWHYLTSMSVEGSIPANYIVFNEQGNKYIELDPIPDTDLTEALEIVYEGYQDPLLFPDDYADGTIELTKGSAAVAGTTTVFTSAMVGRFLQIDDGRYWYDIYSVTDGTNLTLVNYYQDDSISGADYTIAELPRLPSEFHKTPLWGAVRDYYLPHNAKKAQDFEVMFARDLILLQRKYQSKTKGNVEPGIPVSPRSYKIPRNYPKSAIG